MAASITRIIRKALPEIIQSKDATTGERLEACKLLWKIRASTTKGKPRGRAFLPKATDGEIIRKTVWSTSCQPSMEEDRLTFLAFLAAHTRVEAPGPYPDSLATGAQPPMPNLKFQRV
jgi:hypothetical protein